MRKLLNRTSLGFFVTTFLLCLGTWPYEKHRPLIETKLIVETRAQEPRVVYMPVYIEEEPKYEIAHPVHYPHNTDMRKKLEELNRYPELKRRREAYVVELRRLSTLLAGEDLANFSDALCLVFESIRKDADPFEDPSKPQLATTQVSVK